MATKARPPSTPPGRPHNGLSRLATLDGLAINDFDPVAGEALRQWGPRLIGLGIENAEPGRAFGQQGRTDGDRQPLQFAVDGAEGGLKLAAFLGLLHGASAAAVELQQGIADEVNQEGEREDLLVAAPPVLLEDLIEQGGIGDPPPQCQDGLGQGHPGHEVANRSLQEAPSLKNKPDRILPMHLLIVRYELLRKSGPELAR